MDYMNQNQNQNNQPYMPYRMYPSEPKNTFAIVAMVLGICSILSLCTVFLPLPLAALSIVFVILSKRQSKRMSAPAISGLITSLIAVGVGVVMLVSVMTTAFNMLRPENRELLDEQFEKIYGVDFNDYMERIYGEDFDDMMRQIEDQMR